MSPYNLPLRACIKHGLPGEGFPLWDLKLGIVSTVFGSFGSNLNYSSRNQSDWCRGIKGAALALLLLVEITFQSVDQIRTSQQPLSPDWTNCKFLRLHYFQQKLQVK